MKYKQAKLALAILLIFSSSISLSCFRRRGAHPGVGLGQERALQRFIFSIVHGAAAINSAAFCVLAFIHRDEMPPYLFASGAMAGSYALCMGIKRGCEEALDREWCCDNPDQYQEQGDLQYDYHGQR